MGTGEVKGYSEILKAYEALPWYDAQKYGVTKIAPQGHESLSFFPGQRGFAGTAFPVHGIMLVANNYDNLSGWKTYEADLAARDESRTMATLLQHVIPEARIPLEQFWFTNYCLGVMDRETSQYRFKQNAAQALQFKEFFEHCVEVMKPGLIVSLGAHAAGWLGTDYAERRRVVHRVIGGHPTRLLAAVHTSAWTWKRKGFSVEDFKGEGKRIRDAIDLIADGQLS